MIVGKLQLVENIKRDIPDNANAEISPNDVRHNLIDIVDSVHLFTYDQNLLAKNFATQDTRTTRAGIDTIKNLHLDGYATVDNSAFGYGALEHNYTGSGNTSVGSFSLGCNLYGSDNTAIGVHSIEANVFGSGNVAVGNHALKTNKHGKYNIAIGYGAGHYIGENESYKLFIASHGVVDESLCGSGLSSSNVRPLLFGDLNSSNLRLGVGVSGLHNHGALQVQGHISPSKTNSYYLGDSTYQWKRAYISDSINEKIYFSGGYIGLGTNAPSGSFGLLTTDGGIVPSRTDSFNLGAEDLKWNHGFFKDITVSGNADITSYTYKEISSCVYECRTLYLAASGACSSGAPPCGFLDDQQVEGAGLVVQTSGVGYNQRKYDWIYKAPDATQTCLDWRDDAYSRSTWNSNISVALDSGCFYKGDRLIGRDNLSLVTENNCYGIFINRDDDVIRDGSVGRNEVQEIKFGKANKGTFTLSFGGQTTSALAYDATGATVEDALESLSSIGAGNVSVVGNAGGPYVTTFTGALANTNVDQITIDTSGLSLDGSATTEFLTRFYFRVENRLRSPLRLTNKGSLQAGDTPGTISLVCSKFTLGGTFKIKMVVKQVSESSFPSLDLGVPETEIETADIPWDAGLQQIADAINVCWAANGMTGHLVTMPPIPTRLLTPINNGRIPILPGTDQFGRFQGSNVAYGMFGKPGHGLYNRNIMSPMLYPLQHSPWNPDTKIFEPGDFYDENDKKISYGAYHLKYTRAWNDKYVIQFKEVDTSNIVFRDGGGRPSRIITANAGRECGIDVISHEGRTPLQNLYVRLRLLYKADQGDEYVQDPSIRYVGVAKPNAEFNATNQAAFYSGDRVSKVQAAVNNAFGEGLITVSSIDSAEAGWVSEKSFKTGKKWSERTEDNEFKAGLGGGDYHDRNVENSLSYGGLFFSIADSSEYSDINKYELVLEPYYWAGGENRDNRGKSIWTSRRHWSGESAGVGNDKSNFYGGLRLDTAGSWATALYNDLNTQYPGKNYSWPDLEGMLNYWGWYSFTSKTVAGAGVGTTSSSDSVAGEVTTLTEGSENISLSMMARSAVYVTKENNIEPNPLSPQGKLANVTDVNFIATSGNPSLNEERDYEVSYMSLASGVKVGQKFVSRTSRKVVDPSTSLDRIVGFGITYSDEKDVEADTSQKTDRLTISAYDDEVLPLDAVTIMRSDVPAEGRTDSTGLVGITNMSANPLPQTIFNVQATGESIARLTSDSNRKASLQLLHGNNFPEDGFEAEYNAVGSRVDLSVYSSFNKSVLMTLDGDTKFVGFGTLDPNEMITVSGIDDVTGRKSASISISEQDFTPTPTEGFGKLYVKSKSSTVNQNQSQTVMFLDDGGNSFDLTFNKFDVEEGMILYSDSNKNTYGGINCPDNRTDIVSQGQLSNTAYGNGALNQITTGDGNLAIGVDAGKTITAGSNNVILGTTANDLATGSKNIAIGYNNFVGDEDANNNIIIGNDELGKNLNLDNTLLIGHGSKVLIKGTLGPNEGDKELVLPKGSLSITSTNEIDTLKLTNEDNYHGSSFGAASIIEKIDTNSDWPDAAMAFVFTGSGDAGNDGIYNREALFSLRHNAEAMEGRTSYFTASPARPTAELRGDLNLRGAIRFGDGTSIESSSGTVIIAGSGLSSQINTAEGNQQFNLDIEELTKSELQSTITAENSYLALSTDSKVGKISISELNPFVGAGLTRILDNYNHAFTDTSTIDTVSNSYTNYFGYRAGHDSSGIQYTNFMGPEAGYQIKTADYSNFLGYRAGYQADNAQHAVFIGSSAGYNADDSAYSIFIGDSAGQNANSSRSIGIGDNALESVTGTMNIELTAGVGGSNRIIGNGNISNKLAIGNIIGGDMVSKKVSIGVANVSPTATLQVQSNSSDDTNLQEWRNEAGAVVAYLTRNGDLYLKGTVNVSGIS